MDSTDRQVLKTAIAWCEAGHRVALATVVRTWGSAPRPPGAWAALRDDGAVVGSVSGGCIEEDLIRRVREGLLAGDKPEVVTYGVSKEEAARFGLPCGGTLQLALEPRPHLADLRLLQQRIAQGLTTARILDVASGAVTLENATRDAALAWDGRHLTTIHGPPLRLLIIGAGQISAYLAFMAQALDYAVTVCDPREEYRAAWDMARTRLVTDMPDDAVTAFMPDARTAIVALTHDPKLDDMALLEALRSPAFYVGALGSRANNAKRRERLGRYFGMTPAELARLHGPVGLRIGSRTPPEIALAIMAEMTALKNGVDIVDVDAARAVASAPGVGCAST
ncbi:MAG: XdhC family protein [Rhodocyclaceae bacterium]|nr:XdhC family protein [Rhodocyclaceae bacterium]